MAPCRFMEMENGKFHFYKRLAKTVTYCVG